MRHALSAALLVLATAVVNASECSRPIYLTFDVGNMRHADHIARVLREEGVTATFFLANNPDSRSGHVLDDSWGDYWRTRVSEGHTFGNHTWSHLYAREDRNGRLVTYDRHGHRHELTEAEYCTELTQVNDAFRRMTGQALSPIWRAPGGRTTALNLHWAARCGYPQHVGWSPAGLVGDELPSDAYPNKVLVHRAVERLRPGDVVLMHLGIRSRKEPLAESLQPLIRGLKTRGHCFAPVPIAPRHD
jgi:peptidoglycan/xylan/chitin deacetylase (PgdA/CDA1 family)